MIGINKFPVWAVPGVVVDMIATAFGVAFGTCLAMIIQVNRDYARGKIGAYLPPASVARVLAYLPDGKLKQSIGLGAVSVLLFVPPIVLALILCEYSALDRATFTLLKAGLSAVEAMLVAPLAALKALQSLSRRAPLWPHAGAPR
jgi:hypothetical protein